MRYSSSIHPHNSGDVTMAVRRRQGNRAVCDSVLPPVMLGGTVVNGRARVLWPSVCRGIDANARSLRQCDSIISASHLSRSDDPANSSLPDTRWMVGSWSFLARARRFRSPSSRASHTLAFFLGRLDKQNSRQFPLDDVDEVTVHSMRIERTAVSQVALGRAPPLRSTCCTSRSRQTRTPRAAIVSRGPTTKRGVCL